MTATQTKDTAPGLEHAPIGLFSVTMGLFGFALALRASGLETVSMGVAAGAVIVLALLLALFALKALRFPAAVAADWAHPVKIAFFPALSISLMLLATAYQSLFPNLAEAAWILGAALHAALTLAVITNWIGQRGFGPGHLSPAWFIPAVGNVVAPIAGVSLGYTEASWYFFAVGMLFWLVLLSVIINRMIFHDPMPGKLRPTLAILIAPPALGFLAWTQLNGGQIDVLARLLFNLGVFFTALVAIQFLAILRLPFGLSFWALSFPLAGMTVASFHYAQHTGMAGFGLLGWALLGVLTAVIAMLVWRTVISAVRGDLFMPD